MTIRTTRIPVGSLTFDALEAGPRDGEPVLLLHGFPQTSVSWRFIQSGLADAGYRSIAPDLRGYSPDARPLDVDAYRIDELIADVVGIADELDLDRFHLIGHDWGGALAWHVAGRHGPRLRTLTVLSTPHPRAFEAAKRAGPSADGDDQRAKSGYMDDFRTSGFEDVLLADDRALLRLMVEGAGMDPESARLSLRHFHDRDAVVGALNWYRGAESGDASTVGPITVPTLYLWSTEDIALGRTAAEATGELVDGDYEFVVLDGVTHWIPEEAPDTVLEHLGTHLRR